jgi:hypothetical protein
MSHISKSSGRGQVLVLFAAAVVVLLLMTGLVIDGGYAFAQRRAAQNAADFAAMAGARIVGEFHTQQPPGAGTDANVKKAVDAALAANQATGTAQYVNSAGQVAGQVGTGSIPASASGVVVDGTATWRPFFLGIMGVSSWTADTRATAMTKGLAAGGVLPIGVEVSAFDAFPLCDTSAGCDPDHLTPGTLNGPGAFGWLSFGADPHKCDGYGLGQSLDGCDQSNGFLQNEIGPPGNSHGCCTTVAGDPNPVIHSFTGSTWGDLTYYVENKVPVWVPIWDTILGNGNNAAYHIVGFGAVILVGQDTQHGKWLTGVRVSDVGDTPNAFGLVGATGEVFLVR